jgi:FkbM family methyltransferase
VFSIMMAKLFPQARITAIEPVQRTFYQMIRNIGLNGVTNIEAINAGVGFEQHHHRAMIVSKTFSGGSSMEIKNFNPAEQYVEDVTIQSLDTFIGRFPRVRLLKMDIEGAEYEALDASKLLNQVDSFVGEFHINESLKKKGFDIDKLAQFVRERTTLVYFERCKMAE